MCKRDVRWQEALLEAKVDLRDREVVVHLLREEDGYQLLVRYPKSMAANMGASMVSLGTCHGEIEALDII